MHHTTRTSTEKENPGHASSSDASAVLESSTKAGHKVFWFTVLVVVGLGSWLFITAEVGYSPSYDWLTRPTSLVELSRNGECERVGLMSGCGLCQAEGQHKNYAEYCEACHEDYQESTCPQTENWSYCSDFLKHYYKCECAYFGWRPNCGPPEDQIQCKAIPKGLIKILEPNYKPEPPAPAPSASVSPAPAPPAPMFPALAPPAPYTGTVYCIMNDLACAPATKCSTDTTGPVKLKCKEGMVTCEEKLIASEYSDGPIGCYNPDGVDENGRLVYPFTDCYIQKES